jgi:lysophospholipase L1-like esterase
LKAFGTHGRARAAGTIVSASVVLIATLSGCVIESNYSGSPPDPTVVMIGDSITTNARGQLHAELDPTYQTKISSWAGTGFSANQATADNYAASHPDAAVIEFGTNDAGGTSPAVDAIAQMDVMIAKFPSSCVVLVNVGTWFNAPDKRPDVIAALNAAMASRAADAPGHVLLADYVTTFTGHPELFVGDQAAIHPNSVGNVVLAQLIKDTLDRCPGLPSSTTTTSPATSTIPPTSTTLTTTPPTTTTADAPTTTSTTV